MRHIKHILAALAILILSSVPALAVEGLEGSVTGGLEFFGGDFNNAKFNEYRVNRDGPWGGFLGADLSYAKPDSNRLTNFRLYYRSPGDVDLCLDTMSYGEYRCFLKYQRFGHTFATDARTLYSGEGTGTLTIPSFVRSFINPGGVFSLDNLRTTVADARTLDLFLTRDRLGTGFEWMSLKPVTLYTLFDYEHREGDRPYGGTFSTSNSIELAEPIDYDTYNVKAGAEYAGKPFYSDVSYYHSTFNNNIQSLTFDNVKQLTGVDTPTNPSRGRNSLPPSNSFDSVSVVLAKNLPLNTRGIFNFNYGWLRQDERLLSPSINPTINFLTPMPRNNADTSVNTSSYDIRVTSSPIEKLDLKAGFRYYQHDNRTVEAIFPSSPNDSSPDADTLDSAQTEYVSWINRSFNAEATYEVFNRTRLGFLWENLNSSYRGGIQNEESENTYRLYADSRALDYLTARLTLEYKNRDALYVLDAPTDQRAFYAADRDRYLASVLVTLTPVDSLSCSANYSYEDTRYGNTVFGLHDERGHVAGVDAEYQPVWWLDMNIFYTYENMRSRQNEFRSDAPWKLRTVDETNTVGGGANFGLIKDRLNLKVDGEYTKVDGDATFNRIITLALPELLPWDHVDETTFLKVGGTLSYNATKSLVLSLGYGFEKWDIQDYQYDGLVNVAFVNNGTLLDMNTLFKPYEVHTVIASATYKF
jgi:MtrB/PioB family decaheme-associated outer membrane protein